MILRDKVAIVTGTSPNIGGGIAEELAAEGAAIVAVDARVENARDCARYVTFLFTKHAARAMIAGGNGGAVINIISTAGHQGEPGNIAYCTAKSGLLNFTRSAAMELVGHGIRVNSLTPTATDLSESVERAARWGRPVAVASPSHERMRPFQSRVPMQRLPRPSDYGRAAAFLASEAASMITGTDLRVDAGAIARYWAWEPGS